MSLDTEVCAKRLWKRNLFNDLSTNSCSYSCFSKLLRYFLQIVIQSDDVVSKFLHVVQDNSFIRAIRMKRKDLALQRLCHGSFVLGDKRCLLVTGALLLHKEVCGSSSDNTNEDDPSDGLSCGGGGRSLLVIEESFVVGVVDGVGSVGGLAASRRGAGGRT